MNFIFPVSNSNNNPDSPPSSLETIPLECLSEAFTYLTPTEMQGALTVSQSWEKELLQVANELKTSELKSFIQKIISQLDPDTHSTHIEALNTFQRNFSNKSAHPIHLRKKEVLELKSIIVSLFHDQSVDIGKILKGQPNPPHFLKRCPELALYWKVISAFQDDKTLLIIRCQLQRAIFHIESTFFTSDEQLHSHNLRIIADIFIKSTQPLDLVIETVFLIPFEQNQDCLLGTIETLMKVYLLDEIIQSINNSEAADQATKEALLDYLPVPPERRP